MLMALGLDVVEETVYRTILTQRQADVAELELQLGISEARLRQVLEKLSRSSLIRRSVDEPESFHVVDPEIGIQALVARQQGRLEAEQLRAEQVRLAAAELKAEFMTARPSKLLEDVQVLDGIDQIRDKINVLTAAVHTEVLTFAPGGGQSEASMMVAKPQDRGLLERGVRMRTLYLDSMRNSPSTVGYAKWLAELGAEVRTLQTLPIRLIIMDRSVAIVPTDGEDSSAGAIVLTGIGTLTALCALFDLAWDRAVPLSDAPRGHCRDQRGLTAQEFEILRMLSHGLTDEMIAKRLGVSPRTARRIVANLLELFGARSRFEAGARAVAGGWLTSEEVIDP
jgi:DNA-binding CsgD family transcriptional regulator/sugar-specific transcriptional regulator TrmB